MLRFVLPPIIALFTIFQALAQQPIPFVHYNTEHGLTHNNTVCFFEDSRGFMWIGTREGLNRFDTYSFKQYLYDPDDYTSLSENYVRDITEAKDGKIWLATMGGGICIYDRYLDKFQNFIEDTSLNWLQYRVPMVSSLMFENDSILWAGSMYNGLTRIDLRSGMKAYYEPASFIADIETSSEDDLYITIWEDYSTKRYDVQTDSFVYVKLIDSKGNELSPQKGIRKTFIDSKDRIWMGTDGDGMFVYDIKTALTYHYSTDAGERGSLSSNVVTSFGEDLEGRIWVGVENGAIVLLSPEGDVVQYIPKDESSTSGFNSNSTHSLYISSNGNVWIGTYNLGINVYFNRNPFMKHYYYAQGVETSINDNEVTSFTEDKHGNIWIGTDGKGVNVFNPEKGKVVDKIDVVANSKDAVSNNIVSLYTTKSGDTYVGGWRGGMSRYDWHTRTFDRLGNEESNPAPLKSEHTWAMFKDSHDEFWISEYFLGLSKQIGPNRYQLFPVDANAPEGISHNNVNFFLEDAKGRLWIGTNSGLNRYNREDKTFIKYFNTHGDTTTLGSNDVLCGTKDKSGTLWFGTSFGIVRYNEESDNFERITLEHGLPHEIILGILADDHNRLWIASPEYITCFDVENQSMRHFDYQSKRSAYFKDSHGRMFFGLTKGFLFFHPDSMDRSYVAPKIAFTNFMLYNRPVEIGPESVLKKHINELDKIELSFDKKVFSISYTALSYFNSKKNQYKYKLEGFEKDWNEVGNSTQATYTNLSPGKYVFKVQAADNEGNWNVEGRSIVIEILPPFWMKPSFITGAIILVILLVYLYMKHREGRLLRYNKQLEAEVSDRTQIITDQNSELKAINEKLQEYSQELSDHRNHLEDLVHQRTAELETAKIRAEEANGLKSAFLANMSHEIRTPLNAIVGFSSLLTESDVTKAERVQFVEQISTSTSTLLDLIEDILDLSRLETNQISLVIEELEPNEVLQDIYDSYKSHKPDELEFKLHKDLSYDCRFNSDLTRLRQIIGKLIDNAFKFTDQGSVELGIAKKEGKLTFYVKDTGVGIEPSKLDKIFNRFYKSEKSEEKLYRGTGLGLAISSKLTKLLGAELQVESEVGKGTCFTLVFSECTKA